jgi:hypothetical protein
VNREVIDVYELRSIPTVVALKDAFELREDRPARWLQRVCLWVLKKLGCYANKETVAIERHAVGWHGEKFMERLWARKKAIWGDFEMEPTRLLLGAADYEEMMKEVCTGGFSFNAEWYRGNREVMGLKVEVVPHMRGMLLLR